MIGDSNIRVTFCTPGKTARDIFGKFGDHPTVSTINLFIIIMYIMFYVFLKGVKYLYYNIMYRYCINDPRLKHRPNLMKAVQSYPGANNYMLNI